MKDHRGVPHHRTVLNDTALEVDDVSDDAVVTDHRRVGRGGMQHRVVLNIRTTPDLDVPVVSTQNGPWPDRRFRADSHITDDHRVRMNVGGRIDAWRGLTKGVDRHEATIPLRPMSRRIDIELTSSQSDGTWTWRAAGAREPKGTVAGSVLPSGVAVGATLRVEVEQGLDGIEVLSIVGGRERHDDAGRLEIIGSGATFEPVIETRAKRQRGEGRRDDRRPRRDGSGQRDRRRDRRDGDASGNGESRRERPRRDDRRGPRFTPPPEVPQRPKPKRLRPGRANRNEVLTAIDEDRRPIAEVALQGMAAVRKRVKEENAKIAESGGTPMPEASVLKMAEEMLPRLRVAEWRDRADAALRQLDNLDLRDLRSVVAAADDPIVTRDSSTRELADRLRVALRERQEQELQLWFGDVDAALAVGRVVRALRLSSQPPKAGVVFPPAIATRLVDSTNATLTPLESAERWCAILEAAAFSPIRSLIKPMGRPDVVADELLATVKRLAPAIPQIAELFGVEVGEGATMPKPLRPTRPGRENTAKRTARPASGDGARRRAKKGEEAESSTPSDTTQGEPTPEATESPAEVPDNTSTSDSSRDDAALIDESPDTKAPNDESDGDESGTENTASDNPADVVEPVAELPSDAESAEHESSAEDEPAG